MRCSTALSAFILGSFAFHTDVAIAGCADLALVLAIDSSGSINPQDFVIQQHGYAEAFRSRRVQQALDAAGIVDVAVVLWGDTEITPQIIPWQRIDGSADAVALAERIERIPRRVTGNTGIGRGIWVALDLLEASEACAHRQIINVSGDGYETLSPRPRLHMPLRESRARAEAMGVTINALAIEHEVPDLGTWYADRVIVGEGAFVLSVDGFATFAEGIARKLEREIGPAQVALLVGEGR